jgi:hypothetical protein
MQRLIDSMLITILPAPVAPVATANTVCAGNSSSLTATAPGGVYQWFDAPVGGTLLATGATYTTPVLNSNTTYYVQAIVNGCTGPRAAANVTVNPIPAAPSAAAVTICSGTGTSLTATAPGGIYQWFDAASAGNFLATNQTYTTPVLNSNTTYYVQATINSCTGPRAAVTVTTTSIPAAPTAAGATICSGNTASLTASAPGGTYQWYDAASNGNLLATNPTYTTPVLNSSTAYYVQSTISGCTGARTAVNVTVNATPVAPTATAPTICYGNSASVTATSPGGSYSWYDAPSNGFLLATSSNYATPALNSTTTYYVQSTVNGCTGPRAAVTVNVTPLDNPAFYYSSGTFCVTGSNPKPVVVGPSGTFSSSPGLVFLNTSTGEINVAASTLGTYTITFTTSGTCVYSSNAKVTITDKPNAAFAYSGPYCQKQNNPLPDFVSGASAGVFTASPAGLNFLVASTGEINLATSAAGTYTVTNNIAASSGCAAANASNTITINPVAIVDAGNNQSVCAGLPVTLNGSIGGSAAAQHGWEAQEIFQMPLCLMQHIRRLPARPV